MPIGSTAEPIGGIPSLSDSEIIALYRLYLFRDPDPSELASERENAMKYSAAGIERQIRNRAGNTGGSGVRGDEGLAPLTVPAAIVIQDSHSGNVITMGPAAIVPGLTPTGPTGLLAAPLGGNYPSPYGYPTASPGLFGLDTTTLLLIAALAAGAYYFFVVRR